MSDDQDPMQGSAEEQQEYLAGLSRAIEEERDRTLAARRAAEEENPQTPPQLLGGLGMPGGIAGAV